MQRKLLVNSNEVVTHDRLAEICGAHGARVCPKVRVKDVLPVDGSGISADEYGFALRSHFDFVVTDQTWCPLFTVEFDGASHRSADAQRRDRVKNRLCEQFGFPLLRINANYLVRRFRQWDLLSYLTETWFLRERFFEAQGQGQIPFDEPFDPCMIISDGHGNNWPYWFSQPAQVELQKLSRDGQIAMMTAAQLSGTDLFGNEVALAHIKIRKDNWVFAKTGMRSQQFPLFTDDLLWQIGIIELLPRVQNAIRLGQAGVSDTDMATILRDFDEGCVNCSLGGQGHDLYTPKVMRQYKADR